MSIETEPAPDSLPAAPTAPSSNTGLKRRLVGGGQSLAARSEPMLWLHGGALVICMVMIVGLLLLVIYQGATTFWPGAITQVRTLDGDTILGEVARNDRYELGYGDIDMFSDPVREQALSLLNPNFQNKFTDLRDKHGLADFVIQQSPSVERTLQKHVSGLPQVKAAPAVDRKALVDGLTAAFAAKQTDVSAQLATQIETALQADDSGAALFALWQQWKQTDETWQGNPDPNAMLAAVQQDDEVLESLVGNRLLTLQSYDVSIAAKRRLFRTGNYELTNEHFTWVNDFAIEADSETDPEWAVLFERLTWGRFYGVPKELQIDGVASETDASPDNTWSRFLELHPEVRARWAQRRELEISETGEINHELEQARLELRGVELAYGNGSPQWEQAEQEFQQQKAQLDEAFAEIREQIQDLDKENDRYQLIVTTSAGQDHAIPLADIVRTYPANQLGFGQRLSIYFSRWWEFLSDDPREANSEGGVFPAIWGTVVMTLLMSVVVVPFGVLAALYLREYAKAGWMVSIVRIAINNLAGVPSIVFGVFGLGFFCYLIGASIDELFFETKLPSPTFGTGGIMWAALTLALLTLPVVIVATEEALAAVPRSMREGSLACGATKWQTIRRIVLPRAMPGIMTGMILAMARGAGEVAPLMLVGAVKLAPELPMDGRLPFVHLERSFMHLGFHIYDLGFQSQNSEAAKPMVFTTTLLLIALIALMNFLAIGLRSRLKKRFAYSQF
ncbi:phosphate ABC transporter permease PstA [Roseimaritima ulvae]|uniref:Phosphate transport system permease protein PstA n=1 Tax=Roseimaritima ulvae TaxID=980254 RepID=A0A5B9QV45_9BACT|nr:phosphate ABC transporter permease PstA [Roseimaritima ulvae]QEG42908.1 Phosphate transport system permease protein PstA [Roseimaritima ulvae]